MNRLLTLLFALISVAAYPQRISHCTIYNEQREPFTVYLNGEKKNDIPSDRVRMINLPQPYYRLKIEFKDMAIPPIEKNFFKVVDEHGNPVDIMYALKKNKKGDWGLVWKSQTIFPDYINAPNQTIISVSGQPADSMQSAKSNVASATAANVTYTPAPVNVPCTGYVLSQNDFNDAIKSMAARGTEDSRLLTARQFVSSNCVTTVQVKNILKLFSADDKKFEIAREAYNNTVDKGNYFKLNEEFLSEYTVDELNRVILNPGAKRGD